MGLRSARVRTALRFPRAAVLLLPLLLTVPTALAAQAVRGLLVDEDTGSPVRGASIMLLDHEDKVVAGAFTDDDGAFLLRAPRLGRYSIQADRIGYRRTTSPPVDLRRGEVVEVELRLSTEAIPVAPLTVVSDRPALVLHARLLRQGFYERRERLGAEGLRSGYFMDREEIRRLNPYRVSDVVGSVPGVWGSARHRGRASNITMRRGCNPTIYVDGVELDHGLDIEEVVPASTLVGVEIYTSIPSPMRFYDSRSLKEGRATRCGSIVLWTGP